MLAFCGSRISQHLARRQDGALVCLSVPIARTGIQKYRRSELGLGTSDALVEVERPDTEVFSPAAMASFEGLSLCDDHPPTFVRPENWSGFVRGHCQNIRRGPQTQDGDETLIADLVISDANLIEKVLNGKRGISCGYDCEYVPDPEKEKFTQTRIRGNHVAVVQQGRAGAEVQIHDAVPTDESVQEFSEIARKFHRRNILSVPRSMGVRYNPSRASLKDSEEKKMDSDRIEQRLDVMISMLTRYLQQRTSGRQKLSDEASEILRSAKETERLMLSGAGPAEFHQQLRQVNEAYNTFCAQSDAGRAFEDAAREAGQRMRDQYLPRGCRPSLRRTAAVHTDSADDWATTMNRAGRELREQRPRF